VGRGIGKGVGMMENQVDVDVPYWYPLCCASFACIRFSLLVTRV